MLKLTMIAGLLTGVSIAQSVWFEPNVGQVKGQTEWVGHATGAYLYITGNEVVYANKTNVHMRLVGAAAHPLVEGVEPTGGYSSYFTGRDEKTWFTGIPHYTRLRYTEVYPGIDLVYYGSGHNVEYDLVVKPGANPARIEMAFSEPVKLDHGDLIVAGLRQRKPLVLEGQREIQATYKITGGGHIELALASYDRTKELTIDPVLEFSTYVGGPGEDHLNEVKIDAGGNAYICGATQSPSAPGLNPFQQTNLVGLSPMLLKLSPRGDRVLYYVVLSSGGWDDANSLALDPAGNIILVGSTRSANFPLKNAIQTTFKAFYDTAFATKISADGRSLIYSTYFGGSNREFAYAVGNDLKGNAYFTGQTQSNDFLISNAWQSRYGGTSDCFLVKLSPEGALAFSTYFGGPGGDSCRAIVVNPDGSSIVGAQGGPGMPLINPIQTMVTTRGNFPTTPALVKFTQDGTPVWSTYVGGPVWGGVYGLALDSAGNIYASGWAADASFVTRDAFQSDYPGTVYTSPEAGFFMKLAPDARSITYASYFSGSGGSTIHGIAVDSLGAVYLGGTAQSSDFPTKNSLATFKGGGILGSDCFAAKFAPDGRTLIYSTLLGGSGNEVCSKVAVDSDGNLFLLADTLSADFPVKNAIQPNYGGGNGDGIIAKLSDTTPLPDSPLKPSPSQLIFRFIQGGSASQPQVIAVSGGLFAAAGSTSWLAVNVAGASVSVSVLPAGLLPGTYNGSIALTPTAGTAASIGVSLTVLAPAAVVSSVDPALVLAGSDDTTITIHGSGFSKNSLVQVDGLLWTTTPVVFVDASTIKLSLPGAFFSVESNHTIAILNPQSSLSNLLSVAVGKPAPVFTGASVVNAASFAGGPVAPGEIVTVFGTNLDQTASFDFIPTTLVYSSPTQMSITVPYTVTGRTTTLRIGSSVPVTLELAPSATGIFAAVANGDGTLTLYATGCGVLTKDALPVCQLPVSATVNGEPAQILYAGAAPGLVQGANQINVLVPSDIASGPISIVLTAGTASSKTFSYTLP